MIRATLLVLALGLLGACGPEDSTGPRGFTTVGERIGDLSEVCLTERHATTDGALGWAYGVCEDPECVTFFWVYGDDDGRYLGESAPRFTDTRCIRPASPPRTQTLAERIGARRVCTTEAITYQGKAATAYAVCADACPSSCLTVTWIYGQGEAYLGETGPVAAPSQCST